jgi:serine protease Do
MRVHIAQALVFATAAALLLTTAPAAAQTARSPAATRNIVAMMNEALRDLSKRVAPSVVEVRVTGYRPVETADERKAGLTVSPMDGVGSGVIVEQDGLIITNAHVLAGADGIEVELTPAAARSAHVDGASPRTRVPARVVGSAGDLDLALLKIDVSGLQPITMVDSASVRQGDMVFAFGSPEGLGNSMTMGIVSAVARQLDEDSPNVFIQTDAPINPGNSGGPLVNADGDLIGISTLIVSGPGGSNGLGFAIPSNVVMALYPELRDHGAVPRGSIGIQVQGITTELATGLHLSRNAGVIICDVTPGGPAQRAGAEIQDILVAVNGVAIANVPTLALQLFAKPPGDRVTLTLLRGSETQVVEVDVGERPTDETSAAALTSRGQELLRRLGIVATNADPATAIVLSHERIQSGVLVVARDERSSAGDMTLAAGDIIHAVNGITVSSIDGLRVLVDGVGRNTPLILQIERDGRLRYVTQRVF